jgi:hypothetical protein
MQGAIADQAGRERGAESIDPPMSFRHAREAESQIVETRASYPR